MVEEVYEGKVLVIHNMIDMRALTCDWEIWHLDRDRG